MDDSHTPLQTLQEDVPLAPFTTFGIGGNARYFVEATDPAGIVDSLAFARRIGVGWCVLGGGSNVLVGDRGFDGLVIRLVMRRLEISGEVISAGAGAELTEVVDLAASRGLAGIELLAGIPGTVGGAVRGNAGAFGTAIGDVVEEVEVVDADSSMMRTLTREECRFDYRTSIFKKTPGFVIVRARLHLSEALPEQVRRTADETIDKRGGLLHPEKSAGSFFLNPEGAGLEVVRQFEEERGITCRNCRLPAGWLIERAGLKGRRHGGAMVSERHANYIINTGGATAEDVVSLATEVKDRVRALLGVELQEEVSHIGF